MESTEDRINKRKQFLDPVVDRRHQREIFMVKLRKKNKQTMFNTKRNLIAYTQQVGSKLQVRGWWEIGINLYGRRLSKV